MKNIADFSHLIIMLSNFICRYVIKRQIRYVTIGFVSILFLPIFCFSIELTLEQAVKTALENNSEVQLANLEFEIKDSEVKQQMASFIPLFNFNTSYTSSKDHSDNSHLNTENQNYQAGIVQKLPLGGELSLTANYGKSDYFVSSSDSIDDNYYTEINLHYKQSLLKDGIFGPVFAHVKESMFLREMQKEAVCHYKANLVNLVETAFYQTALHQRETDIYQDMLKINQKIFDDIKSKHRLGLIPEIDVMSAQIKLNETEERVLSSMFLLETSVKTLKIYLDIESDIKVINEFKNNNLEFDLQNLTAVAMESNRELAKLEKNLEKEKLLAAVAKNRCLPQVDLYASMNRKDHGSTFNSASDFEDTEYKTGIIFIYPFYPVDPEENYIKAQKKVQQLKIQLASARLKIKNEIKMLYCQIKLIEKKISVQKNQLEIHRERMDLALNAFKERLIDLNIVYDIQDERISGEQKYFYYLFERYRLYSSVKQLTGQI